jgi:hypothetical protein
MQFLVFVFMLSEFYSQNQLFDAQINQACIVQFDFGTKGGGDMTSSI